MATKKTAKKAKVEPTLVFEDGQYYIVKGKSKLDVGRNRRYAEQMLADAK